MFLAKNIQIFCFASRLFSKSRTLTRVGAFERLKSKEHFEYPHDRFRVHRKFLKIFSSYFELNFFKISTFFTFLDIELKGRGRYFLDLARENRFRALIFERRFLHEFLSYTYDFFTRKKVRKYILKSKSFLPHQKVFYPPFQKFFRIFC